MYRHLITLQAVSPVSLGKTRGFHLLNKESDYWNESNGPWSETTINVQVIIIIIQSKYILISLSMMLGVSNSLCYFKFEHSGLN